MRESNMKIYFYTQDFENYGTKSQPYWKPKGGSDFILEAESWSEEMVSRVYSLIEFNSDFFNRLVIGHLEVCREFMTDFEEDQLRYDGKIEYPAIRMTFESFIKLNEETAKEFQNA